MGLTTYIIRRIAVAIPTFFGITLIIFVLIQMAPGDIIDFYTSANPDVIEDAEQMEKLKERLGLGQPIPIQYFKWVSRLIVFDFGHSFETHRKISEELKARLGATTALFLFSHLIGWPIAIAIGILSAIKPNSVYDHFGRAFALVGIAMPAFWIGLMLILVFGVKLRWFPLGGSVSSSIEYTGIFTMMWDHAWHLVLPSVTIALRSIATTMRMTRAEMLEVLKKDYIITARAKGVAENVIRIKHALRNSLMSVVTLIGLSMGYVFSGAVLTETVFGWPGIGRYMVHAVNVRDYPAVMAVAVLISMMVLLANLITDITYCWINPRIRYD
ncbi:MAG: ABC transporter permease [Desulfobacteraceae bacterium]|nr:ABC transporter permease [Desulfobacteraceae bacterium]